MSNVTFGIERKLQWKKSTNLCLQYLIKAFHWNTVVTWKCWWCSEKMSPILKYFIQHFQWSLEYISESYIHWFSSLASFCCVDVRFVIAFIRLVFQRCFQFMLHGKSQKESSKFIKLIIWKMTGICDDNTPISPLYSRLHCKESIKDTISKFYWNFQHSIRFGFGNKFRNMVRISRTVERIFKIVASANAKEIAKVTINYTRLHIEYYMWIEFECV